MTQELSDGILQNLDDGLGQFSSTLTPTKDTFIDKAGAIGVGILNSIPGGRAGTEALLAGFSGQPADVIDSTLNDISKDHPKLDIVGTVAGAMGSTALSGVGVAANGIYGALVGAGNVAHKALITEDPISIEKAITEIGGEALFRSGGAAISGLGGKAVAGLRAVTGSVEDMIPNIAEIVSKHTGFTNALVGAAKGAATGGLLSGGINPLAIAGGALRGAIKGAARTEAGMAGAAELGVQNMARAVSRFDTLLEGKLGGLIKNGVDGAGKLASAPLAAWKQISDDVFGHDPEEQTSFINQYLKDHPANVVAGMQTRSAAAHDFMKAQIRANTPLAQPLPYDEPFEPTDSQKAKIVNSYNAIKHPLSVFDEPSPEGLAAINAVYPALMGVITRGVINKVAETPDMPYEARNRVSQILGQPLDSTQTAEFGARMTQRYQAQAEQDKKAAQTPQKDSARGQKAIEQSQKATLTAAQKLQSEN